MEAPEKIWMNDDWISQFDDKDFMGEDSVEYIRKDAFIEKACKWLRKELVNFEDYNGMGEELISDFRKAMEE